MAGKGVKKGKLTKFRRKGKASGVSANSRAAASSAPQSAQPPESFDQLMHQKEEIEALLSSLEDAYSEAAILEQDYNDIKSKNEKKLDDINRKIEVFTRKQESAGQPETRSVPAKPSPVRVARPQVALPVIEEVDESEEEMPLATVEEKTKKAKKTEGEASPSIGQEDLKKLEVDLAEKIKEMVEDIGAKVTEKDLLEMRNNFAKYEAEIDKMKAQVEAVKEGKKIDEEKIQRVSEGIAEIRTMVYGREASAKEQEIRIEKIMDVARKLEPEKIIMELSRRDKELGNQNLRLTKIEETTKEFGEMLKRIEKLLQNIGSLEHVLSISNEASEKLMAMENINRSNQKMLDKIQGIYAELSKRLEEFVLYRAKQDRLEDLTNDVIKNVDELTTKAAYFVTKDDLESLRANIQSSIASAPASASAASDEIASQKEEIEMLLKTLEDEFKNRSISKEEYEKMKNANLAKLKDLESKKGAKPLPLPAREEPKPEKPAKPAKAKEPVITKEAKSRNDMLLKDLEETYKKGFISKEAYEKTRKTILGKR